MDGHTLAQVEDPDIRILCARRPVRRQVQPRAGRHDPRQLGKERGLHQPALVVAFLVPGVGKEQVDAGQRRVLGDEHPSTLSAQRSLAVCISALGRNPEADEQLRDVLERELPALAARSPVPVFLGGHASAQVHDALKRAGVMLLGPDLKEELPVLYLRLRDARDGVAARTNSPVTR